MKHLRNKRRKTRTFSPLAVLMLISIVGGVLFAAPAQAQTPICASAASDSDGDGWGWENEQSCIVAEEAPQPTESQPSQPTALDTPTRAVCNNTFDPDGDGWGFENNQSCAHRPEAPTGLNIFSERFAPLLLSWNEVPGAAGYVVFRNGEAILETTELSIFVPGQDTYFVKAFRQGKVAFSHASRPVQFNGERGFTTSENDELAEPGCRTGRSGENLRPTAALTRGEDFTSSGGIDYAVLEFDEIVLDCDAAQHELIIEDENTGARRRSILSNDQATLTTSVRRVPGTTRITLTSIFHDGEEVRGTGWSFLLFEDDSNVTVIFNR